MKQVVQPLAGGAVEVLDVPRPTAAPTEVLVRTLASVLSPGTEGAVTALARSGLVAKAKARPDLVRQVVRKARTEGIGATASAVRSRLAGDVLLGYSAAGQAIEVGDAVTGIRAGQIVATAGAGKANHAEYQAVPGLLCAVVPEGVPVGDAAFATLASIPLHALRLARVGPGSKVVVIGLGLIGQLAARLAMAAGCDVAGVDPAPHARAVASASGVLALDELGEATTAGVLGWSRGRGADAVLVCAATPSPEPVARVPALCRDRASVVIVGDVGLRLDRTPFYQRELSLRFARSYGPGRYEPSYEEWGVDYPAGQVRWTEGRNLEAVLDLLAARRLAVSDLVTHSFAIADAAQAYQLIERRAEPYLAISLTYPQCPPRPRSAPDESEPAGAESAGAQATGAQSADGEVPIRVGQRRARVQRSPGVGWIGAGAFSSVTLLPAFHAAGFGNLVAVTSASGVSARRLAERHGFETAVSGAPAVMGNPDVAVVVVATPHDSHEELATLALTAGRHVWCEKPLALTADGVDTVEAAWRASGRQLMIGFNRRWAPAVLAVQGALAQVPGPRFVVYRIAAGPVPEGHWYRDRRQGGRLLGEVCHFVDTAQALVGAPIEEARSVLGGGDSDGGGVPGNEAAVCLRFGDGSLATICYGSARAVAGKERIEIMVGPHYLVIDDFRVASLNGGRLWKGRQDKGHRAQAAAFLKAVAGEAELPTVAMIATMRATVEVASRA